VTAADRFGSLSGASAGPCVFVFNGFYAGRRELGGTSSWELAWLASLQRFFGDDLVVFNPDLFGPEDHRASDEALSRLVDEVAPRCLFMIYNPGHAWKREFISRSALERIHAAGVLTGAIWGDIQLPGQRRLVRKLRGVVDVNICTASGAAAARFGSGLSTLYTWVPVSDPVVPVVDRCQCGVVMSYAGSLKGRRGATLRALREQRVAVHSGGGEAGKRLSREEFVHLLAHDVGLSFSGHAVESLVNARSFEIVNQGTLLLEEWGRETAKWFVPFEEYIPWFDERDLADKVRYFDRNRAEAMEIARNAQHKWSGLSDAALWARAIDVANSARIGAHGRFGFAQPLGPSLLQVGRTRKLNAVLGERVATTPLADPIFTSAFHANTIRHGLSRRIRSRLRLAEAPR
jgi:hypothetical protein